MQSFKMNIHLWDENYFLSKNFILFKLREKETVVIAIKKQTNNKTKQTPHPKTNIGYLCLWNGILLMD